MTPSKESLAKAREIVRAKGGVCLVPKPGHFGLSSHEKTFCDCEVEEMIATALDAAKSKDPGLLVEALEWYATGKCNCVYNNQHVKMDIGQKARTALEKWHTKP
jgi:hypothetical protein